MAKNKIFLNLKYTIVSERKNDDRKQKMTIVSENIDDFHWKMNG